jgi:hypothetical protein
MAIAHNTFIPTPSAVIPTLVAVIPTLVAVIPTLVAVIPDLIRDPWIADQVRNDERGATQ